MPVPTGVALVTLNITPPDGVSVDGLRVRAVPTWRGLHWTANGQSLATMIDNPRRGIVSLEVPSADQEGFVNSDEQPAQYWSYILTVDGSIAGVQFQSTRIIQPVTADGTLTFDVVSSGGGSFTLPSRLSQESLDAHYAPVFQPSTAYATGATVLLPAPVSAVGKRTAAGTSRASFDATEQALWTVTAGGLAKSEADNLYAAILRPDIGQQFMAKLRLSVDSNCGIAGDSTGNAIDEWFDMMAATLGTPRTATRIEIPHWNDTNQNYDAAAVPQAGTGGASGIQFRDTFTRTAAELYNTTPDVGAAWGRDGSLASGDWRIDGARAVRTSEAPGGSLLALIASPGEMKVNATGSFSTVQNGAQRTFRIYTMQKDVNNAIFLNFQVSTTGVPSAHIYKRIGGTNSLLTGFPALTTVASDAAAQAITMEIGLSGLTITAKINDQTVTGTLTQTEADALVGALQTGIAGGIENDALEEITVTVSTSAPAVTSRFYNASMSGSNLTYQQTRLAAMYPVQLDLLFINSGHNYSTDSPTQYIEKLDAFVAAFRAVQPTAGIVVSSQNPQKSPAANIAAHKARNAALSSYARRRGFGYLPVAEAFAASSGGGLSLVNADGIHPTNGTTDTGSSKWRDVALAYMNAI